MWREGEGGTLWTLWRSTHAPLTETALLQWFTLRYCPHSLLFTLPFSHAFQYIAHSHTWLFNPSHIHSFIHPLFDPSTILFIYSGYLSTLSFANHPLCLLSCSSTLSFIYSLLVTSLLFIFRLTHALTALSICCISSPKYLSTVHTPLHHTEPSINHLLLLTPFLTSRLPRSSGLAW